MFHFAITGIFLQCSGKCGDFMSQEFSNSIDDHVWCLALTEMYKDGKINDNLNNILDFNIQRAERAEKYCNELIERIKELSE